MGGIKNKLSKPSNKVKILLSSLSLKGAVSRRLTEGSPKSGPRLPSQSLPLAKEEKCPAAFRVGVPLTSQRYDDWQMSVAHRWGRIAKYTCTACLSLAILSTLILNIVSSYSSSKVNSNAEPVSNTNLSTLANDSICDPSNTNAASCISMSISSHSATGDTNDGNLSLTIPQGGGLVAGRHTVSVKSNNVSGVELQAEAPDSKTSYPPMTHESNDDYTIDSLPYDTSIANSISYSATRPITNNTYGLAIPGSSIYGDNYDNASIYESYITNPRQITPAETAPRFAGPYNAISHGTPATRLVFLNYPRIDRTAEPTPVGGYGLNIYYGVRVDHPEQLLAGNYQAEVVYTATTNEVEKPTITNIDPNQYELGSGASGQITINGTNLRSAYSVYIANTNGDKVGDCTSIQVASDTQLTCTVPTDQTNPDLEPGDYTIHVVTQGGEDSIGFTYTEKKALSVYDSVDNVRVDWDANMIPVYHTGDTTNAEWTSLTQDEINDSTATWFNYTGKRWANAVTVKEEALDKYQNKHEVVDEADILGYWVYIPRYAYMVMRRDAVDKVVTDEEAAAMGGFNIKFETVDDVKKTPAACSNSNSNQYYQDCSNVSQEYGATTGTAWATHPAFTWGTEELNGFWIGKFETTGTRTAPTIKPNQHANISEYIGEFYGAAKSIGVNDPNNTYGGASSDDTTSGLTQHSHNLAVSTSHMLKNSEWGAVAYLSASKYGAGVNNVQINAAYLASGSTDADGTSSRYGATGCGPEDNGVEDRYDAGTVNKSTIESSTACGNAARAYNGSIGVLASTTNNVYGVYDMAGGAWEYVMGNYSTNLSQTSNSTYNYGEVKNPIKPPYVDIYNITSNNSCTWDADGSSCGGHALFETASRGGDYSRFVYSSLPWFERGGDPTDGSDAGVFASNYANGYISTSIGFRVALLAN